MTLKWRVTFLILILVSVTILTGSIAIGVLYQTAFETRRADLIYSVNNQTHMMESLARSESAFFVPGQGNGIQSALTQIIISHLDYDQLGQTREFTLAARQGDMIKFVLHHGHGGVSQVDPIPYESKLAEAMRRALNGEFGTMIGPDYRGVEVLAAYGPVAIFNMGLVVKIDMAEIRAPFFRAGGIVMGVSLLLILIGTMLFFNIGDPIIRQLRESVGRLKVLFEILPSGVVETDLSGCITLTNPAYRAMTGFSESELAGMTIQDVVTPDERDRVKALNAEILENHSKPFPLYFKTRKKEGGHFNTEVNWNYKQDVEGNITGFVASILDLTERKDAEERTRREKERAEQYLQLAGNIFIALNSEAEVVMINDKGCEVFGMPREEILGKNWFESFIPSEEIETIRHVFDMNIRGDAEFPEYYENRIITGSGERLISWHISLIRDGHGSVLTTLSYGEDITEKRQIEDALRESDERYRDLYDAAPTPYVSVSTEDASLVRYNRAFKKLTGYGDDELTNMKSFDLYADTPDGVAKSKEVFRRLVAGQQTFGEQLELRRKDGLIRWVEVYVNPIRDKDRVTLESRTSVVDITDRKRAEMALMESENRYRSIIETARDAIVTIDKEGMIVQWNPAAESLFGWSGDDALGKPVGELLVPDHLRGKHEEGLAHFIATGRGRIIGKPTEITAKHADGSLLPVEILFSANKEGAGDDFVTATIRDIRERKQIESRVRKLSSAVEQGPAGVIITDLDGHIEYVNSSYCGITGYAVEEVLGKNPNILKSGHQLPELYEEL